MTNFQKLKDAEAMSADDPAEALRICNEVLSETPFSEEGFQALFLFGYICLENDRIGLAYHIFKYIKSIKPECVEAYVNLGLCIEQYSEDQAEIEFAQALHIDPDNISAKANLALIKLHQAKPRECIGLCLDVLKVQPNDRHCLHNMGLARLMLRNWSGWVQYSDTLGVKHREQRNYGLPEWDYQSSGQILVYAEQGLGDEIMFSAMLPLLRVTNRVIFDCDARMESIFTRTFGRHINVYGTRFKDETPILKEKKPKWQMAIGQLCSHFLKTDEDFKKLHSFRLQTDASFTAYYKAKLGISGLRPVIGFSFKGGLKHTGERHRTALIHDFARLFEIRADFICLDYKELSREEMQFLMDRGIHYLPEAVKKGAKLEATFGITDLCDYVVTVCTSMVYISYSIGKPTFVLVPYRPGYRYHSSGDTFPWSDNVKLYRGEFENSIKRISKDVENFHRLRQQGNYSMARFMSEHTRKSQSAGGDHPAET